VKFASRVFALLVCLFISSSGGFGQGTDASLTGIVTDPSHAGNFQCENNGSQQSHHLTQEATTDSSGSYFFLSLPVGIYTLTVEQNGFNKATAEITLETAQRARQDIELQVGQRSSR